MINKGHTFTTETDTEVLLHGFEEWGMEELLKKMEVCQMVLKDSFYPLEISSCGRSFLLFY